ncbi:MAG: diguanylate cyclase [Betaproteobacteria bacterium]|nr:diguanylate cyclase [Betaproteobacteria bacterium]
MSQQAGSPAFPPFFGSAENFFAAIDQSLGAMVAYVDIDERFVYANRSFAEWLHRTPADLIGRRLIDVYGSEAYAAFVPNIHRALAGQVVRYERELKRNSESAFWISVNLTPHRDADGKVLGLFVSSLEVDDLKRTHDQLHKALQVQAFHMDNSPLAVVEFDYDVRIQRWSGQAERIFGWSAEDVVGRRAGDIGLVHPDWVPNIRALTVELLEGRAKRNRMISRNGTKSGKYIYCEWFNSAFVDGSGKTMAILSLAQDVTLRVEAEEHLRHAATHDSLTGLQNRQSLMIRLDHALARCRRSDSLLALLYIDLDNFKPVNDTHGHAVGDELLCQVAARLKTCVREVDTVARLGGDEFVVLLEFDVREDTHDVIRQRIVDGLRTPFTIGEQTLACHASIGVSQYPGCATTADHLLVCADQAMYRAKAAQ